MIIRSAIVAVTALLLTGAAVATPVLKADIVVKAGIVTVGDMFEGAGAAAEQPLFRAPEPGTSGMVDIADIDAALSRIGIEDFETQGLVSTRVTRAAAVV